MSTTIAPQKRTKKGTTSTGKTVDQQFDELLKEAMKHPGAAAAMQFYASVNEDQLSAYGAYQMYQTPMLDSALTATSLSFVTA